MNNATLQKLLVAYIVGIGLDGIPNSYLWLAVDPQMRDLQRHQMILDLLKDRGIVEESKYFLTLTKKGHVIHEKIAKLLASASAVQQSDKTAPKA